MSQVNDIQGLYRHVVEQAADALIFTDTEGQVALWNAACETVFGFTASEALGRSIDLIIPESLRAAHGAGFNRAVSSGTTKYSGRAMTTRSLRKDGSTIYVDMSFSLVKDDAGRVIGSLAMARDTTEAYLARRTMKARITELESAAKQGEQGTSA